MLLLLLLAPKVKKGLHASIKNIVDVHWTCVSRKKAGGVVKGVARKRFLLLCQKHLWKQTLRNLTKMENQWREAETRVERQRIKKSLGMYGWAEGCELGLGDGPQQFTTFHFRSASRKVFLNNIHK